MNLKRLRLPLVYASAAACVVVPVLVAGWVIAAGNSRSLTALTGVALINAVFMLIVTVPRTVAERVGLSAQAGRDDADASRTPERPHLRLVHSSTTFPQRNRTI